MASASVIISLLALFGTGEIFVLSLTLDEGESSIEESYPLHKFSRTLLPNSLENGTEQGEEELGLMMKTMMETNRCTGGSCNQQYCSKNHKSKRRYFSIKADLSFTMSAACGACPTNLTACWNKNCGTGNGVKRLSYLLDGKLMESSIEVCHNDILVVDMECRSTEFLIHWHGIRQWGQPYMDGENFVTQCVASPVTPYRHEFVATDIGTHFWYSSLGPSALEGFVGSLIVRSGDDPWNWLYDKHVIMLKEWQSGLTDLADVKDLFPEPLTDAIIINGRGADCKSNDQSTSMTGSDASSPDDLTCSDFPLAQILVEKGKHHRLRLINAGSLSCPVQIQIDSHLMTVIAADGSLVEPVPGFKTIIMLPGERYDVILSTIQRVGVYWIHFKGLGKCAERKIFQRALLVYKGATSTVPSHINPGYRGYKKGQILNPLSKNCIGMKVGDDSSDEERHEHKKHGICAYQLKKLKEKRNSDSSSDSSSKYHSRDSFSNYKYHSRNSHSSSSDSSSHSDSSDSDYSHNSHDSDDISSFESSSYSRSTSDGYRRHILITLEFNIFAYQSQDGAIMLAGQMNNISLVVPTTLMYGKTNFQNTFPEFRCRKDGSNETCLHIIEMRRGDKVDIILKHSDVGDPTPNAFHLHGFKFQLLYQGHSVDEARDHRTFCKHPSIRDTVVVPAGGVARIRFHANNRGLWLLGSTRKTVLDAGLGVLLQVGDAKDFPAAPEYLPTC